MAVAMRRACPQLRRLGLLARHSSTESAAAAPQEARVIIPAEVAQLVSLRGVGLVQLPTDVAAALETLAKGAQQRAACPRWTIPWAVPCGAVETGQH